MKVAVSATGKDLNCQIDPRFGRCQYFIFINPETMEFEALDNEGLTAMGVQGFRPHNLLPKKVRVPLSQAISDPTQHQPFQLQGLRSIWYLVVRSKRLLRAIKREVFVRPAEQRFLPTSAWEEAAEISQQMILEALDGLPEESVHCALLASNTLKEAIKNYFNSKRNDSVK
jgi:hypothetical protein